MANHRRAWSASIHEKYIREGRGCGSGADYMPWIHVQDFASRGVVSRVRGRTTGRVHHLMSNNELAYFYILDWSDGVTDIREQYPLSDLEYVVWVAAQAGIKYPTDIISGYPYVLTCDFMITTAKGLKARTIKTVTDLSNRRTLEKLEIERRYWQAKGVDWKIVTEREISFSKAKNIEWLCSIQDIYDMEDMTRARFMLLQLLKSGKHSVLDATQLVEQEYMLALGTGLQLYKHIIATGEIIIEMSKPINLSAIEAIA